MFKKKKGESLAYKDFMSFFLLFSFVIVIMTILLADIFVFNEDPGHSEISYMLIGALVGYVASIMNTYFKIK